MTLLDAEAALKTHLGSQFKYSDWQPLLKAIMDTEGVVEDALKAVDQLSGVASSKSGTTICIPMKTALPEKPKQMADLEVELGDSIHILAS
ncbi:hypothetical protein PAXRUDRAFT_178731 [Paxillus rubicundulus Ve08.2h10]|uniref:Uncharacterized protein n=1 Tax=Paxillus rubicundulus Ve08.2h10 TaxID=930991 RepID=A0A0D0BP66_9AGAM|nr:hypothetical protein PAXRUDRAFT_178731 [Paxillus rubicundulus Ve08.2h10]